MPLATRLVSAISFGIFMASCSLFPVGGYDNERIPSNPEKRKIGQYDADEVESGGRVASLKIPWDVDPTCRNQFPRTLGFDPAKPPVKKWPAQDCPRTDQRFVGMALSGGGSRAAVFSAAVLFELQKHGILQHVDVISSVSGGSYTAALYALSCDPGQSCPPTVEGPPRTVWSEETVYPLLEKDFISRWVGNMFWPNNILRYWFTDYTRSQIMASTVNANVFDNSDLGGEGFRFHDLNLQRPNLLINATDFSDHLLHDSRRRTFSPFLGQAETYPESCRPARFFTFSQEVFEQIGSSLDQYRIADAVMASSAFPGVFNDVNLRDFTRKERYVHLFDAGPFDNLGLPALRCVIERARPSGKRFVIIVDAYVAPQGRPVNHAGTRGFAGHFIDLNALDSINIMFEGQRSAAIEQLKAATQSEILHITFQDLEGSGDQDVKRVYDVANGTPTNLKIEDYQATCLKIAARILVAKKVRSIRDEPAGKGLKELIPAGNTYAPDLTKVADCQIPKDQTEAPIGG